VVETRIENADDRTADNSRKLDFMRQLNQMARK